MPVALGPTRAGIGRSHPHQPRDRSTHTRRSLAESRMTQRWLCDRDGVGVTQAMRREVQGRMQAATPTSEGGRCVMGAVPRAQTAFGGG